METGDFCLVAPLLTKLVEDRLGRLQWLNGITCGHMDADGMVGGHMVVNVWSASTSLLDFCADLMDGLCFIHTFS